MAKTTRDSIIIIGAVTVQREADAEAAITPGQVVEELANGNVQKNATAVAADIPIAVAIEDYLQGNSIGDDYAIGARVLYRYFRPGDKVLLILKDSTQVAARDGVELATGGEVQPLSTSTNTPRLIADEAVDASGGSVAVADRRVSCTVI